MDTRLLTRANCGEGNEVPDVGNYADKAYWEF